MTNQTRCMAKLDPRNGAMCVAMTLLIAAVSCGPRPDGQTVGDRTSCSGSRGDSDPVASTKVDLGPGTQTDIPYVPGPEARVVVRTADEWQSVWRRLADTLTMPALRFQDSAVVLVASRLYGSGPAELRIESVRRCHRDSSLIVFIQLRKAERQVDAPTRSLRAVEIPQSSIGPHPARFVERDTVVY